MESRRAFVRKNSKRILSVLAVFAVALALWGFRRQQEQQTLYTKNVFAMNTFITLKAYGPEAETALQEAERKIQELESLFSVNVEGSDIWQVNHAFGETAEGGQSQGEQTDGSGGGAVREIPVHADTLSVIETALRLGEETDGALDISIYPVLREWGFTTDTFLIPEAQELERLLKKVDYRQIKIDEDAARVCVPESVELDLGALAKGYTGDCLVRILQESGIDSAILDLGGNIQTCGKKPDGSLWQVAVKNPFDPGEELGVLRTADMAVVTSGSYERYFIGEDGAKYGHILDPATGYPADQGLASVTIVGERGVVCDGLSTALFVMGREKAVQYWRKKQDFDIIMVTDEGKLYITEGLADHFQSGAGWEAEIVARGQ